MPVRHSLHCHNKEIRRARKVYTLPPPKKKKTKKKKKTIMVTLSIKSEILSELVFVLTCNFIEEYSRYFCNVLRN